MGADKIAEEASSMSVEFSFVCYRDYDSGSDNIVSRDFTTDVAVIKEFIGTLQAKGGADLPEDLAGGLTQAAALNWGGIEAAKFTVVVADAPCHGPQFHSVSDSFPDGGKSGLPHKWLTRMAEDDTQLIFVRINGSTDKMIEEFRKLYDSPDRKIIEIIRKKFYKIFGPQTNIYGSGLQHLYIELGTYSYSTSKKNVFPPRHLES